MERVEEGSTAGKEEWNTSLESKQDQGMSREAPVFILQDTCMPVCIRAVVG